MTQLELLEWYLFTNTLYIARRSKIVNKYVILEHMWNDERVSVGKILCARGEHNSSDITRWYIKVFDDGYCIVHEGNTYSTHYKLHRNIRKLLQKYYTEVTSINVKGDSSLLTLFKRKRCTESLLEPVNAFATFSEYITRNKHSVAV